MAFNFLGTLSKDQLNDLRNFLLGELQTIEDEINYLRVQKNNLERTRASFLQADAAFGGQVIQKLSTIETQLPLIRQVPDQDDRKSGVLISKIKKPFISHIKFKREHLEYKILKLTDAIEQIKEAMDRKAISKTETELNLNNVESLFTKENSSFLFNTVQDMQNFQTQSGVS
jgi:hypothetical protein